MLAQKVDELINTLPQQEKVSLLTKKLREMPIDIKYQILQEGLGIKLKGFVRKDTYLDDIALKIQTQNFDLPSILDLLVEYQRQQKNQGN